MNQEAETEVNKPNHPPPQNADPVLQLVCRLHRSTFIRVEVWSLQALVLCSLYVQRSGKRQWMIPLNEDHGADGQIAKVAPSYTTIIIYNWRTRI